MMPGAVTLAPDNVAKSAATRPPGNPISGEIPGGSGFRGLSTPLALQRAGPAPDRPVEVAIPPGSKLVVAESTRSAVRSPTRALLVASTGGKDASRGIRRRPDSSGGEGLDRGAARGARRDLGAPAADAFPDAAVTGAPGTTRKARKRAGYDAIIVGGGPAGLSAALILGRCRRRVLVCDAGRPRNAASRELHGFLTRDGVRPSELLAIGRRQLVKYGVEFVTGEVEDARRSRDGFDVRIAGGRPVFGRKLLFATGVVDRLPAVDGFRRLYGERIFHCPYCDGWEVSDRPLAVYGQGLSGMGLSLSLRTWSHDVTLVTDGPARLGSRERRRL